MQITALLNIYKFSLILAKGQNSQNASYCCSLFE